MKTQKNRIKDVTKSSVQNKDRGLSQVTYSKEEQIRQVAYELYQKRGCQNGNELADWLKAEELVNKRK
ncbi:MAG: DUF2934 domain-containing protein [Candidatus Omnitrophota bacterium]